MTQIERTTVQSTNVKSIGYDPASATLEVEFASGVYRYFDVPASVAEDFLNSSSKGRYFAIAIKGRFSSHKVG